MCNQYVLFVRKTLPVANPPPEGARTVFKTLAGKPGKQHRLNSI